MKKIMKKLTASATRLLVLALCLGLVSTGWAVTTTGYEDFGDAAGVMLWRGGLSTNDFHASTVIDVAADGTCGAEYAMTWANNNAQSSKRFCRTESSGGYSAPGLVLVYDEAGYKDSADSSFTPLSFGGLWVKVLQAANKPYAITGSSNNGRATEFGNSSYDGMTLFKFEKSFTINRQGAFSFNGTVTVDVAQDAVFSINASYPHQSLTIPSGSTLKLTGAGSVAIGNTDNGLVVDGTLDLSSATRPTLTGTNGGAGLVKISNGASLVLPSGTAIAILPCRYPRSHLHDCDPLSLDPIRCRATLHRQRIQRIANSDPSYAPLCGR